MIRIQGLEKALSQVDAFARNHVRFAASLALNTVAVKAKQTVVAAMPTIFKNPTPYTLKAIYVTPSTKRNLVAYVGLSEDFSKGGTPAAKYLSPEITGGARGKKISETQLGNRQSGAGDVFGSGSVWWMPGERKENQYGNMPGGQIKRILVALNIQKRSEGYNDVKSKRSIKRNPVMDKIFMVTANDYQNHKNHLPPGVYQRTGSKNNRHVMPLLVFTKRAPVYRKRFRFHEMVRTVVIKNFHSAFREAMKKALALANRPVMEWPGPRI